MPSASLDRKSLRKQLIAAREALSVTDARTRTADLNIHLRELLSTLPGRTLGFCWPYRAEPDVRETVVHWLAQDPQRRAALPVVVADDAPLAFRQWTPDCAMSADRYGIPIPQVGQLLQPDTLLIPVNGFNARGFRLGYGGGYFDRTLALLVPPPLTIGIAFELSRCNCLQEEAHDRALDWVVTEAGREGFQERF